MSCKLSFHAVDLIKDLSSYDYTHKLELCLKMYIVVRDEKMEEKNKTTNKIQKIKLNSNEYTFLSFSLLLNLFIAFFISEI